MKASGFTLLEMMLVVFILSTLALTATAFVDNQDDQFRFEETRRRLEILRRAVLGDSAAAPGVVSGFVAENGVLPNTVGDLLAAKPANYAAGALQSPLFDATPNAADGRNDGINEIELSGSAEKLEKGWRGGSLHATPGADGAFKDGWGYDWQSAALGGGMTFASPGKNNAVDAADTGYDQDMADTIREADWSVQLAGLTVRARNQSGIDYSGRLRASLLVFENTPVGGKWKRYTTDALACLDGDGDGLVGGKPCAAEATLTFPAGGYPGGAYASTRVPVGRHLLLLVNDPDGISHSTDDAPYAPSAAPISRQIVCSAAGCPSETLVLK